MSSALALAAVPTVLLVGLVALTLVPVNLQLTVTDAALIVEPHGLDVLWTRRRRLVIPLWQVASIDVVPRADAPPVGPRLLGTIVAGSFGRGADRTFWNVRGGDPLLVIACRPGAPFRAVVLEFADPYAALARTRTVLARATAADGRSRVCGGLGRRLSAAAGGPGRRSSAVASGYGLSRPDR